MALRSCAVLMTNCGASVALLLGSLVGCGVAAAQRPPENIALYRPYRCSVPLLVGWTGLVDGNREADTAPECFATANLETFPKYITIDLGAACNINRVVVYSSANGNTKKVSLECSLDAEQYQQLRQGFIFPDRKAMALSHEFKPRQARYVRLTLYDTWGQGLGGDNCMFLREVEVYGWRPQGAAEKPSDPLGAFKGQEMTVAYPSLRIFRRYCLNNPNAPLSVWLLGDSFAVADEAVAHWSGLLVARLQQRYDKRLEIALGGCRAFTLADYQLFMSQQEGNQPDLVILTLGYDAAVSQLQEAAFRGAAGEIIKLLAENTDALVVIVTPPPVAHSDHLKRYEVAAKVDSTGYAWQLELLAQTHKFPVVRTGAVLGNSSYDLADIYADNIQLADRGHEAVAIALDRLLAGE